MFTWPLVVFLAAVAVVTGVGLDGKYPRPDADGAILLLADGDLDGDERVRMLRRLLEEVAQSREPAHLWAGLMATVALADRDGYAAVSARLGSPPRLPAVADRELLGLGDPLLGNLVLAMVAEVEGDRAEALRRWRQVAAQSRLTMHAFPAELAAAALRRLS